MHSLLVVDEWPSVAVKRYFTGLYSSTALTILEVSGRLSQESSLSIFELGASDSRAFECFGEVDGQIQECDQVILLGSFGCLPAAVALLCDRYDKGLVIYQFAWHFQPELKHWYDSPSLTRVFLKHVSEWRVFDRDIALSLLLKGVPEDRLKMCKPSEARVHDSEKGRRKFRDYMRLDEATVFIGCPLSKDSERESLALLNAVAAFVPELGSGNVCSENETRKLMFVFFGGVRGEHSVLEEKVQKSGLGSCVSFLYQNNYPFRDDFFSSLDMLIFSRWSKEFDSWSIYEALDSGVFLLQVSESRTRVFQRELLCCPVQDLHSDFTGILRRAVFYPSGLQMDAKPESA